ncbi:hypothetical protein OG206_25910 [Streptomyces sp. NBC_01341]|uniref:hypothetical protein n=1 Tax=Streptomyces sp. NBC_01341 TaxID=2903831 RepID=UPI002E0E1CA0|nr:hypothetical protein OG206_25910 [Streptomyces sp. NBC_01341]
MSGQVRNNFTPLTDTSQRRVRRSPLLFTAPLVLLGLLVLILIWETLRGNMTAGARMEWPWRLQLLDTEALGSLLAVAAGAVLARAQYARAVRPFLGWQGTWTRGGNLKGNAPAWRVGVLNGGQHVAVIEAWDCRVVLADCERDDASWVDVTEVAADLTAAGYTVAEDFQLMSFSRGFPLVGTASHETVLVGAFSKRFVQGVEALYMRVRVTDVVGDSHERVIDCMRGARATINAPID